MAQTQPTPEFDSRADKWQRRYETARGNQETLFQKFSDWYDSMYAVINTQNFAPWRSKVYVPILASKAWNLVAKFVNLKPGFEATLRDNSDPSPDEVEKVQKAELKLEYDYDNPYLDEPIRDKILTCLIDATVTGTGIAKVPWCLDSRTYYQHPMRADGTIDMSTVKERTVKQGYNDLIPVNIFNVFVAPSSANLYSAPWIVIKEFKTLQQLKATNANKGIEVYKNLDTLEGVRTSGDDLAQYKKSRNRLTNEQDPIAADMTLDQLEIFECYEKSSNEILTYAATHNAKGDTSWVEIRRQKNPYWHGKYPLVRFTIKKKPYEFWGEGIFEVSHRLQAATNDLFNHYLDNWNLSIDGMLMVEENSNVDDYIVEPGGYVQYRGEKPTQFKFPEPNPNQLAIVMSEIEKAIEAVTLSPYAQGQPDPGTDKTRGTATGIIRLQEAASDIIGFMRTNFQQTINQIGRMWLSNNQQFMSRPVTVQYQYNNQKYPVEIRPEDIQGDMDIKIDDASMLPVSKQDQRDSFLALTQQILQLQQASLAQAQMLGTPPIGFDFGRIASELAERFGQKGFDSLLLNAQSLAQAAQSMQQPHPSTKVLETINFKDLPEDAKQQLLQQLGIEAQMASPAQQKVNLDAIKQHNAAQKTNQQHVQSVAQMALNHAQTMHQEQQAAQAEPQANGFQG